uniref:Uncharacterized protein n=2 Tax=Lotharella globosa TaxID=91324 RepID=A0A7S3YTR5_9EUKA|mmetsp:Transcript_12424/g.25307  ORF Transcript_12424/g.25307 Transcript_12424/m.25307 type:complete len:120 (+) Transcript_12424:211-570(+)
MSKRQRSASDLFPLPGSIAAEVKRVMNSTGWEDVAPIIGQYAHMDVKTPPGYCIGKEVEVYTKSVRRNISRWRSGNITNLKVANGNILALVTYIDGVKTKKLFKLTPKGSKIRLPHTRR